MPHRRPVAGTAYEQALPSIAWMPGASLLGFVLIPERTRSGMRTHSHSGVVLAPMLIALVQTVALYAHIAARRVGRVWCAQEFPAVSPFGRSRPACRLAAGLGGSLPIGMPRLGAGSTLGAGVRAPSGDDPAPSARADPPPPAPGPGARGALPCHSTRDGLRGAGRGHPWVLRGD